MGVAVRERNLRGGLRIEGGSCVGHRLREREPLL